VFGEFNRKAVEGTLMQTYDKPFYDLPGQEFQRTELLQPVMVNGKSQVIL
jgi:hypothetical protein